MKSYTFHVCPHDTAGNPIRWQMLAQYLSQTLSIHIHFELMLDFDDFHANIGQADIIYANPLDSLTLVDTHGFVMLARPHQLFDEAVFIARNDIATPTLATLHGETITSVCTMLPTYIALSMLKKQQIEPGTIVDQGSWMGVISTIWRGEAQYGIVYKDTYDELSEQGKAMVQVFETTNEQAAFHSILVGHAGIALQDKLRATLLTMHTDDYARNTLAEMNFSQWVAVTPQELETMKVISSLCG